MCMSLDPEVPLLRIYAMEKLEQAHKLKQKDVQQNTDFSSEKCEKNLSAQQ